MAQHKAPTAVTIAPVEERSGFALWIEQNWRWASVVLVLAGAVVLYLAYQRENEHEIRHTSWSKVVEIAQPAPTGSLRGSPEALLSLAGQLESDDAAPWALWVAANSALAEGKHEEAEQALARLRSEFPKHPLVANTYPFVEGEAALTAPEYLQAAIDRDRAFRQAHPELAGNPPPPADAPRVKLHTSRGDIVVALYPAEAPKHVENFLKLCREGFYAGTRFHRVIPGFMIQGGDPNSKDLEKPETWGQGGPGYQVDAEVNDLWHFRGVLSAAKRSNERQSSGSQFFLTTADAHHLNRQHVVFGQVVEGMDVVDAIEQGEVTQGTDRPVDPAVIESTEVL